MAKTAGQAQREYRLRQAEKGLCMWCPQPTLPGRSKCALHAAKSLEAARKSQQR